MKNIPQAYRPSYLWFLTTANSGEFNNFCRYYTRSQAGKSTRYRPTLKPLGKPDVEIDVKYSERDRTVRYRLLAISALSYNTEKHLIKKIIYMEID